MSAEFLSRRKTVAALAATAACALAGSPSANGGELEFHGRTRNCLAQATPRVARTPSFTVQRRVTRSPILWKREGKATLGSPNIASARLPVGMKSIQHGSSSGLLPPRRSSVQRADLLRIPRKSFLPVDYMSRNPIAGLLIAKDDQILFEHYQSAEPITTVSYRSRWSSRSWGC